ncbi:hypothetical protein EMIT051CA3_11185 [Pseudomonas chlororaphis]
MAKVFFRIFMRLRHFSGFRHFDDISIMANRPISGLAGSYIAEPIRAPGGRLRLSGQKGLTRQSVTALYLTCDRG